MKKIKVKICNFDQNDPYSYGHFLLRTLSKFYEVVLSDDPDYIFFNDSNYDYLNYDAVRIWYTGENVHPNFNLCDYAIGFDYLEFGDRYFRLPLYAVTNFYHKNDIELAGDILNTPPEPMTEKELSEKTGFCSFVYSNYLADPLRVKLFDLLSSYKKVASGGRYMNNIGGPVESKVAFEMNHKFSIAFENSSREGYTTEKIIGALAARAIPIYWGNPVIHKEFNERRFINGHRYDSFEAIVERVKEIDSDDNLYLSIVNEPIFSKGFEPRQLINGFEAFLQNIIEQPLGSARRIKINTSRKRIYEENERRTAALLELSLYIKKFFSVLYKPFKGLKYLQKLKYDYFQSKTYKNNK